MITDENLVRLIRAVENSVSKDNGLNLTRQKSSRIDSGLAEPTIQFLLDPYENGYWQLKARWNYLSEFSRYLFDETGFWDVLQEYEDLDYRYAAKLTRSVGEEVKNDLLRMTSRISTSLTLFKWLVRGEGVAPSQYDVRDKWMEKIDFNNLKSRFENALSIYNAELYFDSIAAGVTAAGPFILKSGVVYFSEGPRENGELVLVAPRKIDLDPFVNFFESLDLLRDSSVQRIFAPDEALFEPYFLMLSGVFIRVVQDDQIQRSFSRALDYYQDKDYQHCISALGLIVEGYLQRIYSTLLREECPSGLTLGQLIDKLHKRIAELYSLPKQEMASIDPLYQKINTVSSGGGDVATLLRDIVNFIREDRNFVGKKIEDIVKPVSRRSPFPSRINENLNELLKWRNAASHNSRVPLGAHEADRMLFCLVRVVTWWQKQLKDRDWSKTKTEIIDELIKDAK